MLVFLCTVKQTQTVHNTQTWIKTLETSIYGGPLITLLLLKAKTKNKYTVDALDCKKIQKRCKKDGDIKHHYFYSRHENLENRWFF